MTCVKNILISETDVEGYKNFKVGEVTLCLPCPDKKTEREIVIRLMNAIAKQL